MNLSLTEEANMILNYKDNNLERQKVISTLHSIRESIETCLNKLEDLESSLILYNLIKKVIELRSNLENFDLEFLNNISILRKIPINNPPYRNPS